MGPASAEVARWVEPARRLLTFDSLRGPPQEPSAVATAIRIANDLCADEIASGTVARLVGIEGGVVSEVINLESSGVEAPDRRPRHEQPYYEPGFRTARC